MSSLPLLGTPLPMHPRIESAFRAASALLALVKPRRPRKAVDSSALTAKAAGKPEGGERMLPTRPRRPHGRLLPLSVRRTATKGPVAPGARQLVAGPAGLHFPACPAAGRGTVSSERQRSRGDGARSGARSALGGRRPPAPAPLCHRRLARPARPRAGAQREAHRR